MSSPGRCRQFARGNCRFGNKCKFAHVQGNAPLPASAPGSPSRQPQVSSMGSDGTTAPRFVCNLFWNTGSCARGFECTYKHEQKPATAGGQPSDLAENAGQTEPTQPPDFFSTEGLAVNNGSVLEERFSLNPSEAHNHIRPFLREGYQFENAARIQGFVRILASVNDRNKSWNTEFAQSFLDMTVNGNALLRICDILIFPSVNSRIGNGRDVLSFQRGYFPILQFLACDLILKTTIRKNINLLYTTILNNYTPFHETISRCIGDMIACKTWKDPTPNLPAMLQNHLDGVTLFRTLSTVLFQFFTSYRDAIRNHPESVKLVQDIADWFDTWSDGISVQPPRFDDTAVDFSIRKLTIDHLRKDIKKLQATVEREAKPVKQARRGSLVGGSTLTAEQRDQARRARLEQLYDPPGNLRAQGPRHNNDFSNIVQIRIAPTNEELLCDHPPCLPAFFANAPHHLPQGSMDRHLDIQFRLLREELISTIRSSIAVLVDDIATIADSKTGRKGKAKEPSKLQAIIAKQGGVYKTSGFDSVFFQVYTNIEFADVRTERQQVTVGLVVDAPAGAARDSDRKKRVEYWEHSKRLQSGSLVALVIVTRGSPTVYLGAITSFGKDIAESAKASDTRIHVRVSFFDSAVDFKALRREKLTFDKLTFAFLVDNSVMYESIRPFLNQLQTIEPNDIPFTQYISHDGPLDVVPVQPPKYALAPGFSFNLQCVARQGRRISPLNVNRPTTIADAKYSMKHASVLDPSQADAVIRTLTQEVSLIQGPPGTGKSYTAKEILRILFASGIKPIVLIAFTNHALDHMLTSVLDAKITEKVIRVGTRTSDERIAQYTLDKLEREANASSLDRSVGRQYRKMKQLEEEMTEVMNKIQLPVLSWGEVREYLTIHYPEHSDSIMNPPFWIKELANRKWAEEDRNGEFEEVARSKKAKTKQTTKFPRTLYGFWKESCDIAFIQPINTPVAKPNNKRRQGAAVVVALEALSESRQFFMSLGFGSQRPPVPQTNRSVDVLLNIPAVWSMSAQERSKLATHWEGEIRTMAYNSHTQHYQQLRNAYEAECDAYNEIKDENRRRLLSKTDLIACTTTGAAKITSLLSNVSPKVLMVEEAGQVLEAHILTNLVPSVQHLICIGDPEQLRANLATFSLSMDSERGKSLFKFDRSLMERLADGGFPMSQINVQRRMRPEISHFIRTILYPDLIDNPVVSEYPHVRGMQRDIYFLNHTNKEGGSDEGASKFNNYEVEMIRDLVLYFLKQGTYSGPGDIAVLCAYLGQLQKVRAALRDLKIAVSLDERDEQELVRQGLEEEATVEEVLVAKHVRLGTVDIFQGQEAKVVIVSLVRNTGSFETGSASIGFLKSSNRINVALSRAKHGLYILGNAANLRKNETWSRILDEMEARDQIGGGLPIACSRHPDQSQLISKPGQLQKYCPGGGCLLPCEARLPCGHGCPSVCHLDLDNHKSMHCPMPCNRTPCPRKHPCIRECSDDCGDCQFPIYNVKLPCGHVCKKVPCHMLEKLSEVICNEMVIKALPFCEHKAVTTCSRDPATVECREPCTGAMECCSRTCKSTCHSCMRLSKLDIPNAQGRIRRNKHNSHPCERPLYCQHLCGLPCSREHSCNTFCREQCRQQCAHHQCPKPCSSPCAPCGEPCAWSCVHHQCPVVCGSICSRLPCDEPCERILGCGHACPSVCGEPCDKQKCVACMEDDQKDDIVDFIMQQRLRDIDLTSTDIDNRLLTLQCGHIFTVETLDGHCGMQEYYEVDAMGKYLRLKAPPINYQKPPTCPLCKGPITALRYGRITKRATLDILEQNIASTMSHSLNDLSSAMEAFTSGTSAAQETAKKMPAHFGGMGEGARDKFARTKSDEPLPHQLLTKGAMHNVHGLAPEECKAWNDILSDALVMYQKVVNIASTRGAHVRAYEAAYTTLFHMEMAAIAADPARANDAPEEYALEAVKAKIGQPPPRADVRFQIEAFFVSLEIRFNIAQIAYARLEGLPVASDNEDVKQHRQLWCNFLEFLYVSCVNDAGKVLGLAQRSHASRQAARSSTYLMRADFEQARFALISKKNTLYLSGKVTDADRKVLAEEVKEKKASLKEDMGKWQLEYLRNRPTKSTADMREERLWFDENCGKKLDLWMSECDELEKVIMTGAVYQPLSLQEREDIVRAFGNEFTHRGHFYNCENGHTFVITECGGAMQQSTCPECRAPIGGNNHQLLSSNARATEFEAIAQSQGTLPGHFAWQQGA
ncbi:hypothetical protein K474DRAFT_1630013 [Panus rudis PR-1116 ss-1]|nr:hypothetical protein K474DRAFT_1630013 [Panus rudis PR-1116 ss-1]